MTLKHIKIFLAVYQQMNITRAAEKLHMTQPAVSRAIQEIENYYGIHLFDRINHRLYKTESGNSFYAHALHILDSFDNLEKGLKNWDEIGIVRVGSNITLGNSILPQLASQFQKLHPHLQLKVIISNSHEIQQAILDNLIDIAFLEGSISNPYLTKELFMKNRLLLIFPPDHPLKNKNKVYLNDLASYPFLLREKGSSNRAYLDHIFALHSMNIDPLWDSTSTQAIVKGVSCGLGISILPEVMVKDAVAAGTICTRPIEDESFIRENYIIWHKQKHLTKSSLELITLCRNLV
ncbi:MAG: LysR family transcriptional regulator [Clostridiales bacterium]|nr:LysR family transcriptional regulator [Clostridiales bacterium]